MTIADTLHETYTALSANRVRSGLTILGIVIGIASVIALVSVGQGAQASISSSINSLGSNLLIVTPGAQKGPGVAISAGRGSAKTLTQEDADAIASQVANVAAVASEVSGRYQVTAAGTNTNTTVDGVTSAYPAIRNVEIDQGSFITDTQVASRAKVAVLGPTTATDLFGDGTDPVDPASVIGQTIRIKGVEFTVIGMTVAKGGSGFSNADDMVYIPATAAELFLAGDQYLTSIDVQAASAGDMTQVQDDITTTLLARHHLSDPTQADFSVINQADILATASSITGTLTLLLGAIAGISLLVGGIGIMNMMLTTVTERTREIGLRKAIGAKNGDISRQFLAEAIALTLVGGVVGIALGSAISFVVASSGILQTSVSWQSIVLAFGVSGGIGIAFGYYPARRAASLNPIEALRYE
ncbi:MAG: ABC transporter permease [Patescibacteria group bacterium]|nr:ABC transporter permease [Patescibacteria group bacterium]MDE1944476.1 ABC transporter permease [Patescibacteria group bacterium]MDE2057648.1 ABC transporter permease [Patescibacteria group bacterium]